MQEPTTKTPRWQLAGLVLIGTIFATWVLLLGESAPPPGRVTAIEYGEKWPLRATEATLGCEAPTKAYIDIDGRRCGLNGKAHRAGMPRCDDASKTGNAADITMTFIEQALTLCASRRE